MTDPYDMLASHTITCGPTFSSLAALKVPLSITAGKQTSAFITPQLSSKITTFVCKTYNFVLHVKQLKEIVRQVLYEVGKSLMHESDRL
jgi:hypothetical protein